MYMGTGPAEMERCPRSTLRPGMKLLMLSFVSGSVIAFFASPLRGLMSRKGAEGDFRADLAGSQLTPATFSRQLAAIAVAGGFAVYEIRKDALSLPFRLKGEKYSEKHLNLLEQARVFASDPSVDLQEEGQILSAQALVRHRAVFGSLVRALLDHHTMDERQILSACADEVRAIG